ncbi:MAG TPA: FtsX-like permease family protein [Actinomycetota bacterium]|nr:FtsX-like permease family protein [Actinomycetota bacterium]
MFQKGYLLSELRRRWGRTLVTALGLAIGVALVIGIIGVSEGLTQAQDTVLSPLQAIGTDILVTRVAGSTSTASSGASPSPSPSAAGGGPSGGGGGFFRAGGANSALNSTAAQELTQENASVLTDLSSLGPAGTQFTHDFFLSSTLLVFPEAAVTQTAALPGVASVAAGLIQNVEHETGTVPNQIVTTTVGSQTFQQRVTPPPLTASQQSAVESCLSAAGITFAVPGAAGQAGTTGTATPGRGGLGILGGGGGGADRQKVEACIEQADPAFTATFTTPAQEIQQIVNPPKTNINNASYTAAGVDPADSTQGLVTKAQLVSGQWLPAGAPNDILVNVSYANQKGYAVGNVIAINGTNYTIVGLVNPTLTGSIADMYFPLSTLQQLSSKTGEVTQILVKVKDASSVNTVAAEIQKALPGATVVTTQSLANQVTGSLVDAKNLTTRIGGALAAIVLIAAFVIAMLLTVSSISKRVREIGTLRAVGWSRGRVIRQILAETVGIGVLGAALGIGLGYLVALAVKAFAPALTATAVGVAGFGGSSASSVFGESNSVATKTATIHLTAPLHPATLAIGVGLAILGGLIAGGVGAMRASRLSPAEALRNIA